MQAPSRSGFSLVELLVVIAILTLLMSFLAPALSQGRKAAAMAREHAACSQFLRAYASYLTDQRDRTLIGSPTWEWSDASHGVGVLPPDPINPKVRMRHGVNKVWTWTLAGAGGLTPSILQIDRTTYDDFMRRPRDFYPTDGVINPGQESMQMAFAFNPSFGYNAVYVGGSYKHGAFRSYNPATGGAMPGVNPTISGGKFYLERGSDARHPASLLLFASARAADAKYRYHKSDGDEDVGPAVPGNWVVRPPKPHPIYHGPANSTYHLGGAWTASNRFERSKPPSAWGALDARHFDKSVTGMFDGHVESQSLEELRDMRKWSNYADSPDWTFTPRH